MAGLLGIALAYLGYQARRFRPAAIHRALGPVSRLLERRYFVDDLFVVLYRTLYLGLGAVIGWIDRYLVDGVVNLLTWMTYRVAGAARADRSDGGYRSDRVHRSGGTHRSDGPDGTRRLRGRDRCSGAGQGDLRGLPQPTGVPL